MKFNIFFPITIIILGCLFSLSLQFLIPDGVYYSGDAGLKALLTQQLSTGILRFDLVSPDIAWLHHLWYNGLYPYDEPFVYEVEQKYYITFPFTFPLVSAPFYALFGYRGLYIIPLVATWGIWLTFYQGCRRLKLNNLLIAIGLIVLIFASSLTIYSGMYWEHSLAVFLSFLGIMLIFPFSTVSHLTDRNIIISGILLGLSVWFRPEFLCVNSLIIFLILLDTFTKSSNFPLFKGTGQKKLLFFITLIATIGLFFLCNKIIYGHWTGIHGIQIVEQTTLKERIEDFILNFQGLTIAFIIYFPLSLFPLVFGLSNLFNNKKNVIRLLLFYLLFVFLIASISLIVPTGTAGLIPGGKQWGTRFLLILLPFISLLIVYQLKNLFNTQSLFFKRLGIVVFTFFLILSIHQNTYQGISHLRKNYQRIKPTIEILKESPPIIAISHQFVAQVLAASVPKKYWFTVTNLDQLKQLSMTIYQENYTKFTYICYPFSPCPVVDDYQYPINNLGETKLKLVKLPPLTNKGKYSLYPMIIKKD